MNQNQNDHNQPPNKRMRHPGTMPQAQNQYQQVSFRYAPFYFICLKDNLLTHNSFV